MFTDLVLKDLFCMIFKLEGKEDREYLVFIMLSLLTLQAQKYVFHVIFLFRSVEKPKEKNGCCVIRAISDLRVSKVVEKVSTFLEKIFARN